MSFTSLEFIAFMFLVFVLFYITKGKTRVFVLFIANIVFSLTFVSWNIIVLLIFALYSFFISSKIKKDNKSILFIVLPLIIVFIFFKYITYFSNSILTPVGISFYTFKIISYLVDIYNEKIEREESLLVYLTYVIFFPTLVSGPISRFKPFIDSLSNVTFDYDKSRDGAFLCACGMFEKMVIADYIGLLVSNIYANTLFKGYYIWLAILLYSLQIYADFDSYSNIAIGCSKILGIDVGINFKTPYLSSNIKEFWHKWHISLSTWFKDYVYIPLGGNRKGTLRKHINMIIVFILSGIWHGSTINFFIWGLGHGLLIVFEEYFLQFYNKLNIEGILKKINKIIGIIINYLLVSILFVFFRTNKFIDAINILRKSLIFEKFDYTELGLVKREWYYLLIMIVVFIIVDIFRSRFNMIEKITKRNVVFRWSIYIIMMTIFLIFGMYGSQYNPLDFIYKHF
ncbi:MAG: MBOAT family protein [Erysipelotrichaceae bacterium]|nr:MBOAT family protein [Erysipelotrichaceae bacterium]